MYIWWPGSRNTLDSRYTATALKISKSSLRAWYGLSIQTLTHPISQVPPSIRQISHNAPFCNRNVHTYAHFCYKIQYCGIWCIVEFMQQVYFIALYLYRSYTVCRANVMLNLTTLYRNCLYYSLIEELEQVRINTWRSYSVSIKYPHRGRLERNDSRCTWDSTTESWKCGYD